ncbi:hypothetical protein BGY98DRAFT_179246 [Russula aff. rugulosa BPL654]|nr:hypothetical protein BGY98DRAFT_179246 [Russula aff. rugulosa BPL654]
MPGAVSGSHTMPWQPTLIPTTPLVQCLHSSYPPSSGHRTFIATTARTSSRRDGRNGCKHGDVERRLDDWHKAGWPKRANCNNESVMHRSARQGGCKLIPDVHTYHLGVQFVYLTLRRLRGVYLPSLQHPRGSKTTRMFNRARACTESIQRYYTALKRASPGYATNCACDVERRLAHASFGLLLPHHELLRHLW